MYEFLDVIATSESASFENRFFGYDIVCQVLDAVVVVTTRISGSTRNSSLDSLHVVLRDPGHLP